LRADVTFRGPQANLQSCKPSWLAQLRAERCFIANEENEKMSTLKKSLQTLGSIAAVGGMIAATPLPAAAQATNPCAPKAGRTANPCAPNAKKKAANPCAPAAKKGANPCGAANPCAPKK
jgi:hypothetical protein